MNIAIDGPAGAGKSTIAKRVAKELGSVYIDTGAMYRALGLYMLQHGIAPSDEAGVLAALPLVDISLTYTDGTQHVILNGEDVSHLIRTEEVSSAASVTSSYPLVREKLVELQQKLAAKTPSVMDGRDIGTVVLPDAELKIYLTASPETRAERRYKELVEKAGGEAISLTVEEIADDIRTRDERDMNRAASPLRQAEDAVCIDSSFLTIDEVTAQILRLAAERSGKS